MKLSILPIGFLPQQFDALEAPKANTSLGLQSAPEQVAGATLFEAAIDGRACAYLALEMRSWSGGRELLIKGAVQVGKGGARLPIFLPMIEEIARQNGADVIAFATIRAGLARQMSKRGYRAGPTLYRKPLQ